MMKKQLPLVFGVLVLLLVSCEDFTISPVYGGPGGGRENGRFYAQNMSNDNYYTLYADKLYSEANDPSTKCVVWAEKNCGISSADAKKIADEYNDKIYPKMMAAFGEVKSFNDALTGKTKVASDTMEFADYYGDGDGKLCILLLKIKDDYKQGVNNSFVAGYFTPYNYLQYTRGDTSSYYTNECDMIYLDVKVNKPGAADGLKKMGGTLAHEMQHLMNFITSLDRRLEGNSLEQMDLWIDEGLSSAAEYVYSGEINKDRVDWFNEDPTGRIAQGNNFYVWDNYPIGSDGYPPVLDDYATVSLFFQWLRLQAGGDLDIYKDIIQSSDYDFNAVLDAAKLHISNYNYAHAVTGGWRYLLRNWMAANYRNASTGPYGYEGAIKDINTTFYYSSSGGTYDFQFFPGEGIYSKSPSMPSPQEKIKFAGIPSSDSSASSAPNDENLIGAEVMLSYNIDTELDNVSLSVAQIPLMPKSSIDISLQALPYNGTATSSRNAASPQSSPLSGPYAISAADMLRLNGQKKGVPAFSFYGMQKGKGIMFHE